MRHVMFPAIGMLDRKLPRQILQKPGNSRRLRGLRQRRNERGVRRNREAVHRQQQHQKNQHSLEPTSLPMHRALSLNAKEQCPHQAKNHAAANYHPNRTAGTISLTFFRLPIRSTAPPQQPCTGTSSVRVLRKSVLGHALHSEYASPGIRAAIARQANARTPERTAILPEILLARSVSL